MIWVLTARFHPIRSANTGTWRNTKYKNRIFSEIDFELRVLYREEVVQSAWLNYGKISSSDQAEPQRLLYNIEMKKNGIRWETGITHIICCILKKFAGFFDKFYFQSKEWYFVQLWNRLISFRSGWIGSAICWTSISCIRIITSRQWLKLKVFDNWKNRRHRENRLLLFRIRLLILESDWPENPKSLTLNAWIRFTQNKSVTNFIFQNWNNQFLLNYLF